MSEEFHSPFSQLEETTIADLQAAMTSGQLTAQRLVEMYLDRIQALDKSGPTLNALLEINPDALEIARELDLERLNKGPRGPLHGIPLLLKDNIATMDKMETTAGSLALLGSRPRQDAFVVSRLREAGAVILGKTNLSEWANFRSTASSSGWSCRGGQGRNPYVLDRTPCGSSSGSAAAVAANLAVAALGTETDGSILCPASANAVVGIKPTVGLTSRAGVIPIPVTQASTGKFHTDYTQFLDPDGLQGARIGVARQVYFDYSAKTDAVANTAIEQMRKLGAIIIDPADIPTAGQISTSKSEDIVLMFEFKADLNAYLAELIDSPVRTLADIIAFNDAHSEKELKYFGQEIFLKAQESTSLDDPTYLAALEENHRLSRQEGIDAVMDEYQLDALVMPTVSPPWRIDLVDGDHYLGSSSQPAALAGYPAISVPAGYAFELPVGITFMGRAFSEPTLIKLAYAFEQGTKARYSPRYLSTTP